MSDIKKVNIGCGKKPMPGAINIDKYGFDGVDVICDIGKKIPLSSNDFDEAYADYVLCQICDRKEFMTAMNEIWRILKPGGRLFLKVPNAKYPCAFQDPMDCRYFVKETFDYFNKDHYRFQVFEYGFNPWIIVSIEPERKDRLFVIMQKP